MRVRDLQDDVRSLCRADGKKFQVLMHPETLRDVIDSALVEAKADGVKPSRPPPPWIQHSDAACVHLPDLDCWISIRTSKAAPRGRVFRVPYGECF